MPYRVEKAKTAKFAVVYFLPSNSDATAEVFWSASQIEAQDEADRMNTCDRLVDERLEKVFFELRDLLKINDEERVLNLISIWLTEKQQTIRQGIQTTLADGDGQERQSPSSEE
jgi:hypothetical protein